MRNIRFVISVVMLLLSRAKLWVHGNSDLFSILTAEGANQPSSSSSSPMSSSNKQSIQHSMKTKRKNDGSLITNKKMKGSEKSSYPRAMKLRKQLSSKSEGSSMNGMSNKGYAKDDTNSTSLKGDESVAVKGKGKDSDHSVKSTSRKKMGPKTKVPSKV